MYYLQDRPTLNCFFIVDAQTRKIDGAKAIYSFAVIFRYYLVIAGTLATKFRNHATVASESVGRPETSAERDWTNQILTEQLLASAVPLLHVKLGL